MIYRYGDMLSPVNLGGVKWLFFTANSSLNRHGELVMGRGAAKEIKKQWPKTAKYLGDRIARLSGRDYYILDSGVIAGDITCPCHIGAFQVKQGWWEQARLDLIDQSAIRLRELALRQPVPIYLNFPGIGYGRLKHKKQDIEAILAMLPDNVFVWQYGPEAMAPVKEQS